jgi:hypothetical protein
MRGCVHNNSYLLEKKILVTILARMLLKVYESSGLKRMKIENTLQLEFFFPDKLIISK